MTASAKKKPKRTDELAAEGVRPVSKGKGKSKRKAAEESPAKAPISKLEPLPSTRIQLSLLAEGEIEVEGRPSDECYTPRGVLDPVSRLLGGIDTDPCWTPKSLVRPRVHGWTVVDDGKDRPWVGSVWLNPPYSDPYPWIDRACAHAHKGHKVAALLNVDPSTLWWGLTYSTVSGRPADIVGLWPQRIGFLGDFAKGNPARSSSVLFLWNIEIEDALRELPKVLFYRPCATISHDPGLDS
jgi:hypothetical protein